MKIFTRIRNHSLWRSRRFREVLVLTIVLLLVVLHQVAQIDSVKVLRAKVTRAVKVKIHTFVEKTFKDREKLVSISSLVRDREDTMVWDKEIAERIKLHGPIENLPGR